VSWSQLVLGGVAGAGISVVTAPVGISGAVFLLPVQLDLLAVPNPAVTPTNLLYNVVAGPGALWRYHRQRQSGGRLTRLLIAGTLPGVIAGAVLRVFIAAGNDVFHLLAAALLLPLGLWLLAGQRRATRPRRPLSERRVIGLAAVVGLIGGVYGIGGGSILGPILVGTGAAMSVVAPAALASTFLTSVTGAITYALLALTTSGTVAPDLPLGIACGVGGLLGGYVGARLQPAVPERVLRGGLGALAVAIALTYVALTVA
jgi:uncharacterized membrane protein YfcA